MCSVTEPDVFNVVFVQSMAELLAENYHNIWARKKKMELEAKGRYKTHSHTVFLEHFFLICHHHQLCTVAIIGQIKDTYQSFSVRFGHNSLHFTGVNVLFHSLQIVHLCI